MRSAVWVKFTDFYIVIFLIKSIFNVRKLCISITPVLPTIYGLRINIYLDAAPWSIWSNSPFILTWTPIKAAWLKLAIIGRRSSNFLYTDRHLEASFFFSISYAFASITSSYSVSSTKWNNSLNTYLRNMIQLLVSFFARKCHHEGWTNKLKSHESMLKLTVLQLTFCC